MKSSAALVAALVLAPVVLLAQKTSFDYDKTADLTHTRRTRSRTARRWASP